MTVMTIRIPDDVKEAFDKAFKGEDTDAVISRLIWEAAEAKARAATEEEEKGTRQREAANAILELRKQPPYFSDAEIRQARKEGRP